MVLKIVAPEWPLGSAMCKLLWPSMTLVTNSSSATLAVISYDRYRAVVRPTKARFTTRQTGLIIGAIWIFSLLLVLPYVFALGIIDNNCTERWSSDSIRKIYTVGLFVFQYALPLTIIAAAYIKVVLGLRQQAKRMAKNYEISLRPPSAVPLQDDSWNLKSNLSPQSRNTLTLSPIVHEKKLFLNRNSDKKSYLGRNLLAVQMCDLASPLPARKLLSRRDNEKNQYPDRFGSGRIKEARRLEHNRKIVKMLVSVVLLYAICLLPNQIVWLWYEFGSGQSWTHIHELLIFGSLMVYINSSVNPLLYAGMNEEFRKGFIEIIKCHWSRQPELVV